MWYRLIDRVLWPKSPTSRTNYMYLDKCYAERIKVFFVWPRPMCPTSRSNLMYLETDCGLCAPHQDQITCIWRQIV